MVFKVLNDHNHVLDCASHHKERVQQVTENKYQEVLVISCAQAIVYEWAVVVVVIGALIADGTVEASLAFNDLAEDTKVVQVNVVFQKCINKLDKVKLWRHVARCYEDRREEGRERDCQENYTERNSHFLEGPCVAKIVY